MPNLLPYQFSGSNFLAARPNAGLLDGMRLGKTRQALKAGRLIMCRDMLVVCKASGIAGWIRESAEWGYRPQMITSKTDRFIDGSYDEPACYVVSYNLASKPAVQALLASRFYTVCVIDEAHYAKNRDTARTQMLYGAEIDDTGIAARAAVRWILTGTFFPNYVDECWTHLYALMPSTIRYHGKYAMGYWLFRDMYCRVTNDGKIVGNKNLGDLRKRLKGWTLRRTKEQVWKDVPRMQIAMLHLNATKPKLPREEDAMIQRLLDQCETEDELLERLKVASVHVAKLRRLLGMAKIKAVVDWVRDNLDQMGKVVLFAHHKEVMDGLIEGCSNFTDVVSLRGGMSSTERERVRVQFQEDRDVGVFIGQNHAAGDSIALHAADVVVLCEPDWVPGQNDQCLDRISYFEKKYGCTGYFATIPNSVDEMVLNVLSRKSIDNQDAQ